MSQRAVRIWKSIIFCVMTNLLSSFTASSLVATNDLSFSTPKTSQVTFENGLTLIVREDRSAPVVSVQAWCRTGSVHEDKWLGAGLSHILEHMLFKGTQTRGVADIAQTVQDFGGYMNAYTSFDRTVFYVDAPKEGWKTLLEVLTDAIFHSTLPEAEYIKEQEVIRREFAMGFDNPQRMVSELLFDTAYREHPYRYPVIGYLDIYNRLTREDVLKYYQARYSPNNLTFIVVGDVSSDEVQSYLKPIVEKEKRRVCDDVYLAKEPAQLGRREQHEEFNTTLTQLQMAYHVPPITHPDSYALDLLSVVLGQGRSSRLDQEVLEKRSLVHSIGAFSFTPGEAGLFGVSAVCDSDKREKAEAAILEQIEKIKKTPITAQELEKARKQALTSQLSQLQTMSGQAADLGSSWFVAHDINFSENYLKKIQKVTVEDIQRVAKTYFYDDNLTIVSLNPKDTLTPKPKKDIEVKDVTSIQVQRFQLKNGIPVVINRNDRLPLVSSRFCFKSGLLFENATNQGISYLTAQSLLKGTKNRSAEQIANELENLGGSIDIANDYNTTTLEIDTLKSDFSKGLNLAADVLLNPLFPNEEVEKEKQIQLAALQQESDQPMAVCRDLLRRHLFGAGAYAKNPLGQKETIVSINSSQIRSFYQNLLVASNLTIAVFGAVDEKQVLAELEQLFSQVPNHAMPTLVSSASTALTTNLQVQEKIDKSQAIVQIGFRTISVTDPDRPALDILEEALSDLGSRLFIKIREEQGLAYFVGAAQRLGLDPGYYIFYAGTDPAKAEKVTHDLLQEVQIIANEGLTEIEVKRAKAKILGAQKMLRQSNGTFAQAVAIDTLYGLGSDFYQTYETKIQALTVPEIKAVAQKYFLKNNHVIAVVKP